MNDKYIICKSDTSEGLQKEVNDKIKAGYFCLGGASCAKDGELEVYIQSMIKD